MNIELLRAYKFARGFIGVNSYAMRDSKGFHAKKSLELAREKLATGKRYYSNHWHWHPQGNINPEHAGYGHRRLRWIENPAWREVGKAHDIAKRNDRWRAIEHNGWYTRFEEYDETTCGIVYALPARNGERQLIAGHTDENNEGACRLSFDDIYSDEMEAAKAADHLAELYAQECRDFSEADRAAQRYNDLGEEAGLLRADIVAAIGEARAARGLKLTDQFPALWATICGAIHSKLADLEKTREERAELRSNYGRHEGFKEAAC